MEWNGKFYFEWPTWIGVVYKVDPAALEPFAVIVLPDGTKLGVDGQTEGCPEVYETSTRNRQAAKNLQAERVFDFETEGSQVFTGDWESLIPLIDAAAAVNGLFHVPLPTEEYARLAANERAEFEVLKKKLSPRAASLLYLERFDTPSVELYRTGHCG